MTTNRFVGWPLPVALLFALTVASACTQTHDTCDDVAGFRTHITTEITGIESVAAFRLDPSTGALGAIDQFNGSELSNLTIELSFSWIDEEHRFRAPNTFVTSFLDWLMPTAVACSLAPAGDDFKSIIKSINIYSDIDLTDELTAGQELNGLFAATGMMQESKTLFEAIESDSLISAKNYSLRKARLGAIVDPMVISPGTHVFTISITLDDGQSFEVRTPEFLVSGF